MTDTPDYASGQLDVVNGERPDLKDKLIERLRSDLTEIRNATIDEAAKIAGLWEPQEAKRRILALKDS
jgi:inhibitor of KinA sporulation pathway (predicted exonuclease)